jgi:hypothetical protein
LHFHKAVLYFIFDKEEDGYQAFALGLEQDFSAHTLVFEKLPEMEKNPKIQMLLSVYGD